MTWPPLVDLAIACGILLAVLIVYGQVEHFDFTNYDDPDYVADNAYVRQGLTPASVKWAATAIVGNNWMPVTLLSHVVDTQFFGMESGGRHMENVLLHALAAIFLFAALKRATRTRWPSALVAALFALHPVHVESVAWIAERKDVLSAFFGFLALYAYVRYAEHPGLRRYLTVVVLFALGLMSKPMLVTFPFLLLLLDVWPLRRAEFPKVIWEKLPLIALSAAVSVTTWMVQGSTGAVQMIPFGYRLGNAAVACLVYIGQMFWPVRLAVFYPYHTIAAWQVAISVVLLLAVCGPVIYWRRECPYLATGWFWYLGTLVPVMGIVQVGAQARADRYTYIPMVGLFLMLAWGAADLVTRWPRLKVPAAVLAAIACTACMTLTAKQAASWQNSGTLFQHAIDVTADNYLAHSTLASYLAQTGRVSEAIPHLQEVLRIVPTDATAHYTLGTLLAGMPGRRQEAISHFEAAIRIHPDYMEAHYNLGIVLSGIPGRTSEALAHLEAAQRIQPSDTLTQIIARLRAGQR